MEPWDGPAAIAFTDGTVIGAVLDRNGLRPARYWVTDDGLVVLASEVGVLDLDPATVVRKGRLQPGRMFLVDTSKGRIVDDDEIKGELAAEHPYAELAGQGPDHPGRAPAAHDAHPAARERRHPPASLRLHHRGAEGAGRPDGQDRRRAGRLDGVRHRHRRALGPVRGTLYDYFTQLFAQVTNPPLDAIREELVTSLHATVGPEGNLLDARPGSCRQVVMPYPVIDLDDLAKLMYINEHGENPGLQGVHDRRPVPGPRRRRHRAADRGRRPGAGRGHRAWSGTKVSASDRGRRERHHPLGPQLDHRARPDPLVASRLGGAPPPGPRAGPDPGRAGRRKSGDAREVHHMALLIGYGAAAVNPYLALESIDDMIANGQLDGVTPRQARENYIKAACKGVLKIMSKMGISTVASYTGAQVFEAVGLDPSVIDEYFTGTPSRIGGVGLDVLAAEVAARHRRAHYDRPTELAHRELESGGEYQWRRDGEYHLFNPRTVFKLQHATRAKRFDVFREYTEAVDDQSERLATLRGLLRLRPAEGGPVPIEEVEPAIGDHDPVLDRGHVVRVDLGRGPRDTRHRDEPHRRPLQHRRGRRGPRPVPCPTRTATCGAAPSSRSLRAASG